MRDVIRRLEKPHGRCIKDLSKALKFNSSMFHYISRVKNIKYTKNHCLEVSTEREINLNCNCSSTSVTWDIKGLLKICDSKEDNTCADNIFKMLNENTNCTNDCPDECESIYYSLTSKNKQLGKFDKYFFGYYAQDLNIKEENIIKAFGNIHINFESLEYTENIHQISMSLQVLIANIGGYLGLCIGITMISGVEIIVLIFDTVQILCNHVKLYTKY